MKKTLQILSCILLLLNPTCGFLCVAAIGYSIQTGTYWWILALTASPIVVASTLKFYFHMYRVENRLRRIAYNKDRREFSKTHELLNAYCVDYGGDTYELWMNKETKKLVSR